MANNYLQFSTMLLLDDAEQREWGKEVVRFIREFEEADYDRKPDDPLGIVEHFADPEHVGFDVELDEEGLWLYAAESGTPEDVAALAQAYLQRFKPDGYFAFEWSCTCSKPRLDEFGGGAVFVTASSAEWMPTSQWIATKIAEFQ